MNATSTYSSRFIRFALLVVIALGATAGSGRLKQEGDVQRRHRFLPCNFFPRIRQEADPKFTTFLPATSVFRS